MGMRFANLSRFQQSLIISVGAVILVGVILYLIPEVRNAFSIYHWLMLLIGFFSFSLVYSYFRILIKYEIIDGMKRKKN
jgi:hypothetical protein